MAKKEIKRFLNFSSKQSCFLFGPRGTGKSYYLKRKFPKSVYIDLLDDLTLNTFYAHPEKIEPIVKAMKKNDVLIIDEVQKIPTMLAKIHQIIEDSFFPDIQFVLTGSSARKLKRASADLLAGRVILKFMHPFIASELKNQFNLERALSANGLKMKILITSKKLYQKK